MVMLSGLTVVVVLMAASVTWACIPQPRLITLQPRASGPAGTKVTVAALGFDPGRAEIRWNGADGELLGTANGPEFSVEVTIPQADVGLYQMVVLARSASGEIGNTNTVSFEITLEGESAATAPPPTQPAGRAVDSKTEEKTSASAALLFGGGGGLVALGCIGGILLSRQGRNRRPSEAVKSY